MSTRTRSSTAAAAPMREASVAWPFACGACCGGLRPLIPTCSWCDGSGHIKLTPSEALVFDRLYPALIKQRKHYSPEPATYAVHLVRGTHRGPGPGRGLGRTKHIMDKCYAGLDSSAMLAFVRDVEWLEQRGL